MPQKHTQGNKTKPPSLLVKESGSCWRTLTQHSPNHIMLLDQQGIILFINYPVAGLDVEKVPGTSVYDYLSKEAAVIARACYEKVYNTGNPGY